MVVIIHLFLFLRIKFPTAPVSVCAYIRLTLIEIALKLFDKLPDV